MNPDTLTRDGSEVLGVFPRSPRCALVLRVGTFGASRAVDARLWFTNDDGATWSPSRRGVPVRLSELPRVLEVLRSVAESTPTPADLRGEEAS